MNPRRRLKARDALRGLADLAAFDPNGRDVMSPDDDMPAWTYADGSHCAAGHVALNCGLKLPPYEHRLNRRGVATVAAEMGWGVDAGWVSIVALIQSLNDSALAGGFTRTWGEIWQVVLEMQDGGDR